MHQNQNLGIGMPQGGAGSNNNMGKHDNRKIGGGFEDNGAIATPYDTLRQRQTPSTPSANKDSMFMNNNPYFFYHGSLRTVFRIICGLGVLDGRKSVPANVFMSCLTAYK